MDQLPRISEGETSVQINLNALDSKNLEMQGKLIRQLEHKLSKQKELNRDLRVEKDMYTMKLEETEKRLNDVQIR
jgi:hypothetical protein